MWNANFAFQKVRRNAHSEASKKLSKLNRHKREDTEKSSKEFESQKVRGELTVGEQAHNMCDLALVDTNVYRNGLREGPKFPTLAPLTR